MKMIKIDESNYNDFHKLLPEIKDLQHMQIVGCLKDGNPCGALAMEIIGEIHHVFWLYIHPNYRRMRIGSAILDTVCAAVKRREHWVLQIDYMAGGEYGKILDYMLARRGFELNREVANVYTVTKNELMDTSLWKRGAISGNKDTIIPLQKITSGQLISLIRMAEKNGNYIVSRGDFLGANSTRSMVMIHNNVVKGLVLMHDMEKIGHMRLSCLYMDISDSMIPALMEMIREAIQVAFEPPTSMEVLEFCCINEKAEKFAAFFLPNSNVTEEWFCCAVLR